MPNFIIWLPSFSSPWLVQLASKCHLAIFAFGRFLDFFHSVKKVSKPRIFCEIICVSKRTLVILIRILYCTAFFKAKNFVILFFLSFVWFISGEWISLGVIFLGEKFWGVIFTIILHIKWRKSLENLGFYQCVKVELVTLLTNGIVAHSFTCGRSPRSFIIVCLIATKYFCH